jgi:hypothetical protein
MPDTHQLDFNDEEHKILQTALKALAGLESAKLPLEFSAERLSAIKNLAARVVS